MWWYCSSWTASFVTAVFVLCFGATRGLEEYGRDTEEGGLLCRLDTTRTKLTCSMNPLPPILKGNREKFKDYSRRSESEDTNSHGNILLRSSL